MVIIAANHCDTVEESRKMASLLSLCDELLHEVFTLVSPMDLAGLAKTCKMFNAYIKGNKLLWKGSFFMNFVGATLGSSPCCNTHMG
jgi:hypothetical protein